MKAVLKVLMLCWATCFSTFASAAPTLKEGDIWAYKTRPGEEDSRLTILKIEDYPHYGKVIHIRVDGIRLISPVTGAEFNDMPHLPFKAKALQRSLTQRVGATAVIPEFEQGYTYWKAAFEKEKAGAFKISVRQALDGLMRGNWETAEEQ